MDVKLALGDELLMTVNAFNREANARYPTEGTFKRNFPIGGTCTICTIAHDLIMVKSEHEAITGIDRQSAIEMRQAYLDSVNAD